MIVDGDAIKKNISKNITKYREKAHLSQKELAQLLHTTPSRISNWEQGANCPSIDILFEVCKILNVSINDIYGVYPESSIALSFDEQEHIKTYRSLDDSGRQHVDIILQWESDRVARLLAYAERFANYQRANESAAKSSKVINTPEHLIANAAHDMGATPEQKANADRIMMDDDEWK